MSEGGLERGAGDAYYALAFPLLHARESLISSDVSRPAVWSVVWAPGLIGNRVHGLLSRDVVGGAGREC